MTTPAIMPELAASTAEPRPLDGPHPARRFTLDGSDELERHLARTCGKILAEVRQIVPSRRLEALVLGGGYGRGEGGVLKTAAGDRPYNDLEFYVFLRGNRFLNERRLGRMLRELGERLSPEAGLHVEFKVDSLAHLRRSPVTMFSYDLVSGHRVLAGKPGWFAGGEPHQDADKIPLHEATRLLMNRCSGLLFAQAKLKQDYFTAADADFVRRNLAKAQLAFGDVVLTAFGRYHWSCRERRARLRRFSSPETIPWLDEARRHHAAGVEFKLHPVCSAESRTQLAERHAQITAFALVVWLWLESRRLEQRFASARDYALSLANKCPGSDPWRSRLLNAKIFGPLALLRVNCHRDPRESILNALALLLWDPERLNDEPGARVMNQLLPPLAALQDPVAVYQSIWRKLN